MKLHLKMSRFLPFQFVKYENPNFFGGDKYPKLTDEHKLLVYKEVRQNLLNKYSKLCIESSNNDYQTNHSECQQLWDLLYFDANSK